MINTITPDFSNIPINRKKKSLRKKVRLQDTKITIITPFYDPGEVFQETAYCILNQTFSDWIWLIINDCSTCQTSLDILYDLESQDDRIKVIEHEKNQGPSAGRNTGIKNVTSKYTFFIDSDDLIEPTTLEKWIWFLESYPQFSFVNSYNIGFDAEEYLWSKGFQNKDEFLNQNIVQPTLLLRTELFHKISFDESITGGFEDWDFFLACANQDMWGWTIEEYHTWYRRRENHEDKWENWNEKGIKEFRQELKIRYPNLFEDIGMPKTNRHLLEKNPTVSLDIPFFVPKEDQKKNTILFILPWLEMGGSDKFNLDLIEELSNRGWSITIATTLISENSWASEFSKYTDDIFFLENFLHKSDFPRFIHYLIQTRQISTTLISHSEFGYWLLPYLRENFPNVKFVDYCHIEEEYWKNGGYPCLSARFSTYLDQQIVSSEHLKNWIAQKGCDENNISVLYTNINIKKWSSSNEVIDYIKDQYNISSNKKVIFFAGRIHEQKQPMVLAKTIKYLRQKSKKTDFVFIIAGDGPEMGCFKAFIEAENLKDSVILLGRVSNKKVKSLFSISDIFFLPSKHEGIALSVYEAMSIGVCVVGANVGGQLELVTPECGYLLPFNKDKDKEAEEYSKVLKELLDKPNHLKQLGQNSRERIKDHFTIDKMITGFLSIIEEISLTEQKEKSANNSDYNQNLAFIAVETIRSYDESLLIWEEREYFKTQKLPLFYEEGSRGESSLTRLNPANDTLVTSRGIYSFTGSILKRVYNLFVRGGFTFVPKLIKSTGIRLINIGNDLYRIDSGD